MPLPTIFTVAPVVVGSIAKVSGASGAVTPILLSARRYTALCSSGIFLHNLPRMVAGATVKGNLKSQAFNHAFGADEPYPATLDAGCIKHAGSPSVTRRPGHSSILSQEISVHSTRYDGTTRI
jgi:hypothetical protein